MNSLSPVQEKEVEIVASVSLIKKDESPISMPEVDELVEAVNDKIVEFMEDYHGTYFICGSTRLSSPRREMGTEKFSYKYRKTILNLLDKAKSMKERERLKIKYHSILYDPDSRNKEQK